MSNTLKKVVGSIDERLPYKEFIALSQKQASEMPVTITENGVEYEVSTIKCVVKGHMNTATATYKKK